MNHPRFLSPVAGLLLIVGILGAESVRQDDDAARWLKVKAWQGTVTVRYEYNFSGTRNKVTATTRQTYRGQATVRSSDSTITKKTGRWWGEVSGSAHQSHTENSSIKAGGLSVDFKGSCKGGGSYRMKSEGAHQRFTLHIGTKKGEYDFNVQGGPVKLKTVRVTSNSLTGSKTERDASEVKLGGVEGVDLSLPKTGLVLRGTRNVLPNYTTGSWQGYALAAGYDPSKSRMTVTWNFTPVETEKPKVVVEIPKYEDWIPEARIGRALPGNELEVRVRVETADGKPTQHPPEKFVFELLDGSREPGICLNWPPEKNAKKLHDFRFLETRQRSKLKVTDENGLTAEVKAEDGKGSAMVSSFDWGGYATLRVKAVWPGGGELFGEWDGNSLILLPRRSPDSFIADAWKKKVKAGDLSDESDEDALPEGDGHKGDGVALYEEYRGFVENGRHIRGEPGRKELFVLDQMGGMTKTAIARLQSRTGLKIHHRFTRAELPYSCVVNLNRSLHAPHVVDQHALEIFRARQWGGLGGQVSNKVGTPGVAVNVEIMVPDVKTIMHEMLHGCAVHHHGDVDFRIVRWSWEGTGADRKIVEDEVMIFPDGSEKVTRLGEVHLKRENGERSVATENRVPMEAYVAVPGGEHSGRVKCVMRYAAADAYIDKTNPDVRYIIQGMEPEGLEVCGTKVGDGLNKADRKPRPRHGNALLGNCLKQICVNDSKIHKEPEDK